jgi:hypothetical protein
MQRIKWIGLTFSVVSRRTTSIKRKASSLSPRPGNSSSVFQNDIRRQYPRGNFFSISGLPDHKQDRDQCHHNDQKEIGKFHGAGFYWLDNSFLNNITFLHPNRGAKNHPSYSKLSRSLIRSSRSCSVYRLEPFKLRGPFGLTPPLFRSFPFLLIHRPENKRPRHNGGTLCPEFPSIGWPPRNFFR